MKGYRNKYIKTPITKKNLSSAILKQSLLTLYHKVANQLLPWNPAAKVPGFAKSSQEVFREHKSNPDFYWYQTSSIKTCGTLSLL